MRWKMREKCDGKCDGKCAGKCARNAREMREKMRGFFMAERFNGWSHLRRVLVLSSAVKLKHEERKVIPDNYKKRGQILVKFGWRLEKNSYLIWNLIDFVNPFGGFTFFFWRILCIPEAQFHWFRILKIWSGGVTLFFFKFPRPRVVSYCIFWCSVCVYLPCHESHYK